MCTAFLAVCPEGLSAPKPAPSFLDLALTVAPTHPLSSSSTLTSFTLPSLPRSITISSIAISSIAISSQPETIIKSGLLANPMRKGIRTRPRTCAGQPSRKRSHRTAASSTSHGATASPMSHARLTNNGASAVSPILPCMPLPRRPCSSPLPCQVLY